MGRRKQERVQIINDGSISRKALKDSSVVAYGEEPEFLPLNPLLTSEEKELETEIALGKALNWYNQMVDEKHLKSYFVDYAEKNFPKESVKLKHLDPSIFVCGEGHALSMASRLIMRGWPMKEKHVERLEEFIKEKAKEHVAEKEEKAATVTVKARDPKVSECINLVNSQLDDFGFVNKKKFPDTCMADTVFKAGASNAQRLKVHEHFVPMIIELKQYLDGKNPEIKEAYSGNTKANINKIHEWLIGTPSEDLVKAVKKARKPRKKKQKTAAQILKLFTYQKYDKELNINSVEPESLLKAEQLWIFNTKTRKLGVYYAANEEGLTVTRKSIDNYDEKTSYCKTIRKPKEFIPTLMAAGKVALRRILEDVHATKSKLKNRIGNTVLLLKVVK